MWNDRKHEFQPSVRGTDDGSRRVPRRPEFVAPVGKFSLGVFILSFALCLGCLAFLTFLWMSPESNTVWRTIALSEWTARSITITSLVLRWATTAQAVTCTSALAAVLPQRHAVPLPKAAGLSILRFDNTGPWSLLRRIGTDASMSVGLLAALLTLTTLSLQFTSTALLSQVGLSSLQVVTTRKTYYGADPDGPSFRSQISSSQTNFGNNTGQIPSLC